MRDLQVTGIQKIGIKDSASGHINKTIYNYNDISWFLKSILYESRGRERSSDTYRVRIGVITTQWKSILRGGSPDLFATQTNREVRVDKDRGDIHVSYFGYNEIDNSITISGVGLAGLGNAIAYSDITPISVESGKTIVYTYTLIFGAYSGRAKTTDMYTMRIESLLYLLCGDLFKDYQNSADGDYDTQNVIGNYKSIDLMASRTLPLQVMNMEDYRYGNHASVLLPMLGDTKKYNEYTNFLAPPHGIGSGGREEKHEFSTGIMVSPYLTQYKMKHEDKTSNIGFMFSAIGISDNLYRPGRFGQEYQLSDMYMVNKVDNQNKYNHNTIPHSSDSYNKAPYWESQYQPIGTGLVEMVCDKPEKGFPVEYIAYITKAGNKDVARYKMISRLIFPLKNNLYKKQHHIDIPHLSTSYIFPLMSSIHGKNAEVPYINDSWSQITSTGIVILVHTLKGILLTSTYSTKSIEIVSSKSGTPKISAITYFMYSEKTDTLFFCDFFNGLYKIENISGIYDSDEEIVISRLNIDGTMYTAAYVSEDNYGPKYMIVSTSEAIYLSTDGGTSFTTFMSETEVIEHDDFNKNSTGYESTSILEDVNSLFISDDSNGGYIVLIELEHSYETSEDHYLRRNETSILINNNKDLIAKDTSISDNQVNAYRTRLSKDRKSVFIGRRVNPHTSKLYINGVVLSKNLFITVNTKRVTRISGYPSVYKKVDDDKYIQVLQTGSSKSISLYKIDPNGRSTEISVIHTNLIDAYNASISENFICFSTHQTNKSFAGFIDTYQPYSEYFEDKDKYFASLGISAGVHHSAITPIRPLFSDTPGYDHLFDTNYYYNSNTRQWVKDSTGNSADALITTGIDTLDGMSIRFTDSDDSAGMYIENEWYSTVQFEGIIVDGGTTYDLSIYTSPLVPSEQLIQTGIVEKKAEIIRELSIFSVTDRESSTSEWARTEYVDPSNKSLGRYVRGGNTYIRSQVMNLSTGLGLYFYNDPNHQGANVQIIVSPDDTMSVNDYYTWPLYNDRPMQLPSHSTDLICTSLEYGKVGFYKHVANHSAEHVSIFDADKYLTGYFVSGGEQHRLPWVYNTGLVPMIVLGNKISGTGAYDREFAMIWGIHDGELEVVIDGKKMEVVDALHNNPASYETISGPRGKYKLVQSAVSKDRVYVDVMNGVLFCSEEHMNKPYTVKYKYAKDDVYKFYGAL